MSNESEKIKFSPEVAANQESLNEIAQEQREKMHEDLERAQEKSKEHTTESARKEALEKAQSLEKKHSDERAPSPAERRSGPIGKKQREASYNATMKEIQTHMSPSSRAFSKVIHNKAVEQASDFVGATVARPNAIASGAIFAFALTLAVYLIAKNLGYPLSGFETIGAFGLGWVLGLLYDFLRTMVTGKK